VNTGNGTSSPEYRLGDRDERPWGNYVVTGVGLHGQDEFCEKKITVYPGRILSLQSHEHRREIWRVEMGALTAILDGERIELYAGDGLHIPKGSIHCMANPGSGICVIHERQEGRCREEDIRRYIDAYGRETEQSSPSPAKSSIAVYRAILSEIERRAA
jgi:mannose-6-phosphate isomerase